MNDLKISQSILTLLFLVSLFACEKKQKQKLMNTNQEALLEVPTHFPEPHYQFDGNPLTKEGVELGRQLFYDPGLSKDGMVSCGSCHAQVHAFADHNVPLSFGIFNRMGVRNTPGLANLIWFPDFHWDGGVNHLEVQPIAALTDSLEMGQELNEVIAYLKSKPYYRQTFEQVFGDDHINTRTLLLSITQFMSTLVAANAKYDQVELGKAVFTKREMKGKQLFEKDCASRHQPPLFTDFSYRNNGLVTETKDLGRKRITNLMEDELKFRVPSLRNVDLTYPYMHDGSYRNLYQVIDAYSKPSLSDRKDDKIPKEGFQYTEEEKEAIIAFLHTLTDYEFIGREDLSQPISKVK